MMNSATLRTLLSLAGALTASAAAGQSDAQPGGPSATVAAIPPLSTPADKPTSAGSTASIAWQASKVIAEDLQTTAEVMPLPPSEKNFYSFPEVTAPSFYNWRSVHAKLLLTGFVQARPDGRVTFGCYVYDVQKGRELAREGFVADPREWRRAAHKCAGLVYKEATGARGIFDTRIAYVAETGAGNARVKRIAVMDNDGTGYKLLTLGETLALTPRMSPKGGRLAFVSFAGGKPQVRLIDVDSGNQRPLLPGDAISFAPRFSPDGSRILFSMAVGPNTDVYVISAEGGVPRRLTTSPGIDTDASFSPDGSRIVFESDRSGTQQLYVMNADGTDQRRISFGPMAYADPEWSPDGKLISFTSRQPGVRRIGVMRSDGTGERLITNGPADEGASWAPSSRELVFQRGGVGGSPTINRVSLDGGEVHQIKIPQGGSDPDWSGVMD
jgi:TolB protein